MPLRRHPNGCLGLPLQYAVLDVETTGLNPINDRVVEVAVVLLDSHGHAIHEWSTLVDPGIGTTGPRHIHGIASEWLADAPLFSAIAGDIGALLTDRTLIGHNSTFDADFISAELLRAGMNGPCGLVHVDTMNICAQANRPLDLQGACASIGYTYLPHSALEDARATAELLRWLLPPLRTVGHGPRREMAHRPTWNSACSGIGTDQSTSDPRSIKRGTTPRCQPSARSA